MKKSPRIIEASACPPRAQATVELLSTVFRPFLWRVTVTGQYPHAYTRVYDIAAPSADPAAREGLRRFVDETKRPFLIVPS